MMARVGPLGALMRSIQEHDAMILANINALVGRDDELFIIGDFAWDNPGRYRQQIQCKHVKLIKGNHDKVQKSQNVFGECPDVYRSRAYSKTGGDYVKLYMCHYPTMYWDGSHRGWCHLYGHCHGQREEYLDMLEPERRAMDVGVDNIYRLYGAYRPIAEYEVYEYMARRSGHDDVRFYTDYQQSLYVERGLYGDV